MTVLYYDDGQVTLYLSDYPEVARERVSTAAMAPKPDQLDLLEMA